MVCATPRKGVPRAMSTLKRKVKDLGKHSLKKLFEGGQRLGVDILPRHFYSEVPDLRDLRSDESWKSPRSMVGIRGADTAEQFAFVEACCPPDLVARLRERPI